MINYGRENFRVIFVEYEKMPIGHFIMSKSVEKGFFLRLSVSDTLFHLLHINISGMKWSINRRFPSKWCHTYEPIKIMANYPFEYRQNFHQCHISASISTFEFSLEKAIYMLSSPKCKYWKKNNLINFFICPCPYERVGIELPFQSMHFIVKESPGPMYTITFIEYSFVTVRAFLKYGRFDGFSFRVGSMYTLSVRIYRHGMCVLSSFSNNGYV